MKELLLGQIEGNMNMEKSEAPSSRSSMNYLCCSWDLWQISLNV